MTPEQIALVERHLATLGPVLDDVAVDFYRRLFAADPAIGALFTTDPEQQRAKFVAQLVGILATIRRLDDFLEQTRDLGARHRAWGAMAAHYRLVGVALLEALAAASGGSWTDELEAAWRRAYHLTAESMMAGAAAVR